MDLRPWDLWSAAGEPRPETPEILATLEAALRLDRRHPLANHLYVHAVEAGPSPGRGTAAADLLRDLCPGIGHLVHMPSHIDVRTGRWADAIAANTRAIEADRAYRERMPKQVYMAHDRHMLAFAAMMRGQSRLALEAIRAMVAELPLDWLRENATGADGMVAMPYEVLVRFGRWDEVLAEPEPPEWLPLSRALRHAARGTAFAATGRVDDARREQAAFVAARAAVPKEVVFGTNSAEDVLAVAGAMLEGEILVRAGERDAGVAALRAAVAAEDALRYDEPPAWLVMVRHALGATLIADGRFGEAERVYRDDLARWPGNGWSLFGLAASLDAQGKADEAAPFHQRFAEAWKDADLPISSSCCCQPGR
jgi:tetratricopeptide (TPR) repeat protein